MFEYFQYIARKVHNKSDRQNLDLRTASVQDIEIELQTGSIDESQILAIASMRPDFMVFHKQQTRLRLQKSERFHETIARQSGWDGASIKMRTGGRAG